MKYVYTLIASLTLLAGCSIIPPEAYTNRGDPETLLDVSSEIVNLDVTNQQAVDEMAAWIEEDQPTRAELYCPQGEALCEASMNVLELYGVPYQTVSSPEYMAALVYERVLARDCVNRYIDNSINPYHLNYPSFGCSITANMVQQVSDKSQFVRPGLLDPMDAAKAVQSYQNYMTRREVEPSEGLSDSLLSEAKNE